MSNHMSRKQFMKLFAITLTITFLSASILFAPVSALVSQNIPWSTISDTRVSSVATGDVNADGINEIVTAGYYNDGSIWHAQLAVWNPATMSVIGYASWSTTSDTQIAAVAVGDVNHDGKNEIVTGGSHFDGTRWVAQLAIWNGSTLGVIGYAEWFTTNDTMISSLAIGDVNGDSVNEVVCGGSFYDNTIWNAQIVVWNCASTILTVQGYVSWHTTSNTDISSVAVGDVNKDTKQEVITGGSYFDNTRLNSQLAVWNGATLAVTEYSSWFTTSDTQISTVSTGDVNGDGNIEIVTGGSFSDNTRLNSQLVVWNGATLAVTGYVTWFTTSNTKISALTVGNYTSGLGLDIFTAGTFFDGSLTNAQFIDWAGPTLVSRTVTAWTQTSNTEINAIAFGSLNGVNRIITGGSFFDNVRSNAQLSVWT
jgi:hypothetical protein